MSWGNSARTIFITLSDKRQVIRSLMPLICQCGRINIEWIFASYTDAQPCPHCGGSIRDSREMEPITGFYHKVPYVGDLIIDEVTGKKQTKTIRQFSQMLCNWEDEGRGHCHSGLCEWQDPMWNLLAERDKWKEDKATNAKIPVHFGVSPQHLMLAYSYDKKGPGIFRFGNMMKGELEKIYRDKGRLAGRDITIYKEEVNNQTKHIATPSDPLQFIIARDSFDEDLLRTMLEEMRKREEPTDKTRIISYLKGEVPTMQRPKMETQKAMMPGVTQSTMVAPIAIDPTKPVTVVGVDVTPQIPAKAPDIGSVQDASNMKVNFGKHKGRTLSELMVEDPAYVQWISKNTIKDHPDLAAAATIVCSQPLQQVPSTQSLPPIPPTAPVSTPLPPTLPVQSTSVEPSTISVAGKVYPDDLRQACDNILNSEPKYKDNETLQKLLDDVGSGLSPFEKYQISKWTPDRLQKLYDRLTGGN